jgi:hypothetical protein
MSLLEIARDTLKDIPISDVLRERLSLALDQFAEAERKIVTLQTEKGSLQARLERQHLDHNQTQKELERLKEQLAEDIRIYQGVEFRRGTRTGREWMPFCPKCHLPLIISRLGGEFPDCSDNNCGWNSPVMAQEIWGYKGNIPQ